MNVIRKSIITSVLLTSLVFPIFAQDNNLPEYGDIADVKNLQKVYLSADSTNARKLILSELKKYPALSVVSSPEEAEYFIEYKILRQETGQTSLNITVDTSEMVVYMLRDKRRRVVWSKTQISGITRPNEVNLTRNFLKALKKARSEK
ncbi:MAG: hypothetical protein QOF62_2876 [Pyrinomonadaceae bacterium]|jgi:hypothetical protein|nr:hypothetical protein [Pyrinomonadaceae bacterium]